jgi:GNAT superfamily N-acetyltransferase
MAPPTDGAHVGSLRRELGNGLILRTARYGDADQLVGFNATMHADGGLPGSTLADWTRDLFATPHPTFQVERDVTVVEDTASGRIVSALFLIPQVWSYAGVPIATGQPELIATHPDYRRRGLVRAQFDEIHQWAQARGQLWQFISGIPWYYRQFGYTYAADLPPRPIMWAGEVAPSPSKDFTLRAATPADVEFLAELEADATSGTMLAPLRGTAGFSLELARRPGGLLACEILVIEPTTAAAAPVGYVVHQRRLVDGLVSVRAIELRRGTDWLGPTAAVVAHLHQWVRAHPDGPGRGVRFALPAPHPATRCASTRLGWGPPGSYGLYVRVPDVIALLRAIAPVLEARLAASPAVAWTGTLCIDLYQGGLQVRFDQGRLSAVEPWSRPTDHRPSTVDASIRREDFLHLLLGNRSPNELEQTTADFLVNTDTGGLLLDVLFPPMPMSTWEYC